MGTWGAGILQNDTAQDGLVDAAHEVRDAIRGFVHSPQEDDWQRMFAAVGLLVQFSPYTLAPDNPESRDVARAIEIHRSGGAAGRELDEVFDAICAGETPEYTLVEFPPMLETALHGPAKRGFPMQKTWAQPPARCFAFPTSKAFVQDFADRRVARIQNELSDSEVLEDLNRESSVMGDLALLLILDEIHVQPSLFVGWRDAWRAMRSHDESEAEFFERYYECVEAAFEYAIARFS